MKCEKPFLAGDPRYLASWLRAPGCPNDAKFVFESTVLDVVGKTFRERELVEVEFKVAACGVHSGAGGRPIREGESW